MLCPEQHQRPVEVGDLTGRVLIGGDFGNPEDENNPAVISANDLSGTVHVMGSMVANANLSANSLSGTVSIHGLLEESAVLNFGSLPGTLCLDALRVAGDCENPDWGGEVYVNQVLLDPNCYINDPSIGGGTVMLAVGLFCVADMNCDGQVDFSDINSFVAYVSNCAAWQAAYPDCPAENGDVNQNGQHACNGYPFDDINVFVNYLASHTLPLPCSCGGVLGDSYGGDGFDGDGVPDVSPEELAVLLEEQVAPELTDELLALVAGCIAGEDDEPRVAYWEEVYANLVNDDGQ